MTSLHADLIYEVFQVILGGNVPRRPLLPYSFHRVNEKPIYMATYKVVVRDESEVEENQLALSVTVMLSNYNSLRAMEMDLLTDNDAACITFIAKGKEGNVDIKVPLCAPFKSLSQSFLTAHVRLTKTFIIHEKVLRLGLALT